MNPPVNALLNAAHAVAHVVDVADGVDRIMGDRALYLRMIKRFRSDYQHGVMPVSTALARRDQPLAQRLAHTLKGASGMIGAHGLHQRAVVLEHAIRTESDGQHTALAALAPVLADVLAALDTLLGAASADAEPAPRALASDAALLPQLIDLLVNGDGAAVDLLEESEASLRIILGPARLAQVSAAVNEFDFEAALRALRQGTS